MTESLHEDYGRSEEIKGSSDRGFGLTVGGILLVIAAFRVWLNDGFGTIEWVLTPIGAALVVLGWLLPRSLAGLNRAWTKLGLLMFKVVNPVVLGLMYVTTFVPIGLIMRALGRDLLRLKLDPEASTYWIKREPPGPDPKTMIHQF
ncbi:MAG: hypothetical protein AAF637_09655 [Pseudomonadota bacterium]